MQLEGQDFDAFFCSPLQRAAVTGRIIWAGRQGSAQATLLDPLKTLSSIKDHVAVPYLRPAIGSGSSSSSMPAH